MPTPTTEPREIEVCTDCLLFIANGDLDTAPADLPDRIAERWPGSHLSPAGGEDNDLGFKVSRCQGCGNHNAGDKHLALVFPAA